MRCCYWRMELWHATIHRHTHLFCLKMSHIFLHGQWVSSKFKSTYHIMFTVLSFIFRVRQTQMRPSAMFYLWVLHLSCCHGYPLESTPGECVCVCVCVPRTQQRSEEHHSQVKIDILPPTLLNFYTSSHTHTHTRTQMGIVHAAHEHSVSGLDRIRGQKLLSWEWNNKEREEEMGWV